VSNTSTTTPTSGLVTVMDVLPPGLTLVSMSGTGWNCTGTTCTRSDALGANASYPALTVTVKVAAGAASPQQNTVNVSGGGDLLTRSATDSTTIAAGITYSISGHVTLSPGGGAVAGVTVALTGGQTASAITDATGSYAFSGLPGGSGYTLTPSGTGYTFSPVSQTVASLASNQVVNFAATQLGTNVAGGKAATQSSTYGTYTAALAVDGNTNGAFGNNSLSITNPDANAWWQVDLGGSAVVNQVAIWGRTDCCNWLTDYWIFISDTPFSATDTPATLQTRPGTWSNHQTAAPSPMTAIPSGGAQGRYVRIQLSGSNYLEIAEVQVFGTVAAPSGTNLAQGKTATQSSTYSTYTAAKALDGNTSGVYGDNSLSITNVDNNAWWQVDLGASALVSTIEIWGRTDCCATWLSDYWVFVSDTPFNLTDTPATLQGRAGTWNNHQTSAPNPSSAITAGGARGRYVRIQLSGTNHLEMAEVRVFGSWAPVTNSNVAQGKSATQSSTYATSSAALSVDGKTDGVYGNGSVSITNTDANAWWQVDLGATATVNSIVIWGRTDCCASWLNDYWIFVSDTPFGPTDTPATLQNRAGTWNSHQTTWPNAAISIPAAGAQGRYVRVQLTGTNHLEMAEVQVLGAWK
jgi:hypothetical protein